MTPIPEFFLQLRDNPELMPPLIGSDDNPGLQIDHRRNHEEHSCLRCDNKAIAAFIGSTKLGLRWLDLCGRCTHDAYEYDAYVEDLQALR